MPTLKFQQQRKFVVVHRLLSRSVSSESSKAYEVGGPGFIRWLASLLGDDSSVDWEFEASTGGVCRSCHCMLHASVQLSLIARSFYLLANSVEDKESWIGQISKALVRRSVMLATEDGC